MTEIDARAVAWRDADGDIHQTYMGAKYYCSGDEKPEPLYSAATVTALEAEVRKQADVLAAARRAIGDHFAPNDCYATGPMTGDAYIDLVQCPACSFIAMYEAITGAGAK